MSRQSPFLRNDLYKLGVAIFLLILLLWLVLRSAQPAASQAAVSNAGTPTVLAPPGEVEKETTAPTAAEETEEISALPTATAEPPSVTPTPQPSPTLAPSATPPAAAPDEATATLEDPPTPTPLPPTSTPEQAAATPQAETNCPLAMPTRLKVGDRARVLSPLHLRSAPEISSNLVQTNQAGTELEITGGPVCGPFQSGAHLWWEVRRQDGVTGWSAEGAANGSVYFMEAIRP